MSEQVLHDFPRSSASYRVRISPWLKGIACRQVSIDLRAGTGNAFVN